MMMTFKALRAVIAAAWLVVFTSGCSNDESLIGSPIELVAEGQVRVVMPNGLVQTVTLTPSGPAPASDVEIRSVIVNRNIQSIALTSRICALDYAGSLVLTNSPAVLKCAGYSASAALAPNDSVVTSDLMRISSARGQYQLRVRHAVDPEQWVSVPVVVRLP